MKCDRHSEAWSKHADYSYKIPILPNTNTIRVHDKKGRRGTNKKRLFIL
jgi:hypothetical protein